ncbi:MAG: MSHA biogenesis protein MshG [Phycisphaeraceae bacterium]|nr:MAG: MSHA biogenesis protein MshG [Phycisphaeraceae bacterium]
MTQAGTFRYLALDAMGKKTRGTVSALSEHAAYREVAAKGLTPVRIEAGKAGRNRSSIKPTEITTLTRELSVLVQAKIPIATGLVSVAENEPNGELARMTREIAAAIESGEKITDAFGRYREIFGDVYIEALRAAEASGTMGEASSHLADMLEQNLEMRKQLKRALSYPVIVIGFVLLALTVIVVFVVPKFAAIFEQNGVDLPITTQVVQFVGNGIKTYWYLCLGGGIASAVALAMAWKSQAGRWFFERAFLRVPCIGPMLISMTAARFSRVLSLSLGAGLDLTESIAMAGRATGRPVFVEETANMSDRMKGGASLSDVMRESKYLPSFARRMLSAGKDSQELANSSSIIASHYDREADHLAKSVNTLIEPIMTISLAGIVLLVALSVFLPMWQMIKMSQG